MVSGTYTLRVNKKKTLTKRPYFPLDLLSFSNIETLIDDMIQSEGSGVQNGVYTITARTLRVRVPKKKTWEVLSVSDFGIRDEQEFQDLLNRLLPDPYPPGEAIELHVEVIINAPIPKPAFKRNQSANEPDLSSDAPQPLRRTNALLETYAAITVSALVS
ncbi:hypothetical protein EJ04DRAFT_571269 [Polyplosphaeria fusca]|uniref:Uncharacterized protein n=1 Tax=Polyplosphaeria fusca TaxID=682080 RepID=A0A9P4QKC4_9PLEO|nr:hypothetical protein EJ04DRAFT_571269 [Polyplosphaeria fusca]